MNGIVPETANDVSDKSLDDLGKIQRIQTAFSLLRQARWSMNATLAPQGELHTCQAELYRFLDEMIAVLKIRDTCTAQKLILVHFPFHLDWFLFKTDAGQYYEFQPYFTRTPNIGELGYLLRQAGFSEPEYLLSHAQALPVFDGNFTPTFSAILTQLTGRELVTVDCEQYICTRINLRNSYDTWYQHEYINHIAEAAGKIVQTIYAAYKTCSPQALRAQFNCWSALVKKNSNCQNGLKTIRIYMQQEVAEITSDLCICAHCRQAVLLLSHYSELLQQQRTPGELINDHREFLKNVIQLMCDSQKAGDIRDPRIKKVADYIHLHYTESLSLTSLSEQAGLGSAYFSCLFRQETGMTLSNYIRKVRIDHAKMLLHYMDTPITEISYQCGYQDNSYFTREFKKESGCSPLEYRRNIRTVQNLTLLQ